MPMKHRRKAGGEAATEFEAYEASRVPPETVEIWRLARRLSREPEKGKPYGVLTYKALEVLRALLWAFHAGQAPTYETIAHEAACSRDTIAKAIRALRSAGILAASAPLRLAGDTKKT
jgi:hypothetical protein